MCRATVAPSALIGERERTLDPVVGCVLADLDVAGSLDAGAGRTVIDLGNNLGVDEPDSRRTVGRQLDGRGRGLTEARDTGRARAHRDDCKVPVRSRRPGLDDVVDSGLGRDCDALTCSTTTTCR